MPSTVTTTGPELGDILQNAVVALAKIAATNPPADRLLIEMVRLSGQALNAGGAGVWVTETPDRPLLIFQNNLAELQLLSDTGAIPGVTVAVRRCAREGKPLIIPPFYIENEAVAGPDSPVNPSPLELFYIPLKFNNRVALVLVLAVPPAQTTGTDNGLHRTYLNFLARMIAGIEHSLSTHHLSLLEKDRSLSGKLVKFTDQVHKHIFLDPVAVDIANLTRDVLEADRVTVQLYPKGRRTITAVSNVDDPSKRSAVFPLQKLIFDYVRTRQVPIVLDRDALKQLASDAHLHDAATAYFTSTAPFNAFLATPIKADEPAAPVLGVILAEYTSSPSAQAHAALAGETARLCVRPVTNARDVESVPFMRWANATRKLWKKPKGSKRSVIIASVGLALAALTALAIVPVDFSLKADCLIRPSSQIAIVAPVEGRIIEVPVAEGEHVFPESDRARLGTKVKPLAVFDSTELIAQRAEQIGHRGELNVALGDAQQHDELTKMASLKQQLRQVQDQIDLLDHQIKECTVWSPIEGTLLTENVQQKRWSTAKKSEPLMDIASFSDWQLVIDVPEADVDTVRQALADATHQAAALHRPDTGIEVDYTLYAFPDDRYVIHAKGAALLLPASHQNKNANVFRLLVKLDAASLPAGIKMSGLTGRAKLHVGSKPLLAQWLRPATRMLHMTFFF